MEKVVEGENQYENEDEEETLFSMEKQEKTEGESDVQKYLNLKFKKFLI